MVVDYARLKIKDAIALRINGAIDSGDYNKALGVLNWIRDTERRRKLCTYALMRDGLGRAHEEFGKVLRLTDYEQYLSAKRGMENMSPYAVLFEDNEGVYGLEDMIDLVPDDNPVKQLWRELEPDY